MASFTTFLKSIYRDGNDGKEFEKFVKWFLTHDPEWKTQVNKVWLWDEWPERWGIDKGIDLVFQHRDGEIWAVQAKCYDEKYDVTKADVDTFLSESGRKVISKRLLITSTDKLGANAREVCTGQEKSVTHFMRSDFEKAAIDYPADYKLLNKVKRKERPKPEGKYEYQNDAVKAVAKGFKTEDRGQLIMACGTGKTFTTLWVKERIKSKNTLVLLPSLNLLAQTVREWSFASKFDIDVLCVCSDKSVGKKRDEDEVIQSVSDVHFPVHSEVPEIRKFMKGKGDRVIFSTYQSSDLVAQAQKGRGLKPFDLIVADEAHRCAISGKSDSAFSIVLDAKKIMAKKRLFATATPRTYTTSVKKAAEERGVEVVGMDDETAFGKPFHTLTFGEAIRSKPPLLTDYQVVIIGVDNSMIADWIANRELVTTATGEIETDAETLAAQIGLLKAIKDYKLKRVISFHSRVKRAQEFAENVAGSAKLVAKKHRPKGTILADFVSGKMSTADRVNKLKILKNTGTGEVGILSNARCLSEGVDVPSLDGVAFIDPKNSQVDIIQAVGRAIRLSKNKSVGTIVLPVFIEDGEDAEERIEESNFQPIWWVLNALKAHDDVLGDELDTIRTDMGKRGLNTIRASSIPKIVVDLPITAGTSFADALKTRLVTQMTAPWNFWFGLLENYAEATGTARVPSKYKTSDGYGLGNWVNLQRGGKSILGSKKIQKLENVSGWVWSEEDAKWEDGFDSLLAYFAVNKSTLVPMRYVTAHDYPLGSWVARQRNIKNKMDVDRRSRLEGIQSWTWDPLGDAWEKGFGYLQAYIVKNGNSFVSSREVTSDGFKIGNWVAYQRSRKNVSDLDRIKRLEKIKDWAWGVNEARWEEGFLHLIEYVEKHGNAHLPYAKYMTADGFNLIQWVRARRSEKDSMDPERRKRLEALNGWVWNVEEAQWNEGFDHLREFVRENNHARVPARSLTKSGFKLGNWVSGQRKNYKKMSSERRLKLETVDGWLWDALSGKWEAGYEYLSKYSFDNKSTRVPGGHKTNDGYKLGSWVAAQRREKDSMDPERRKRLEALNGWVWSVEEAQWNEGFDHLREFVRENNHASVPNGHRRKNGFNLGGWVSNQRKNRDAMNSKRKTRLENIKGWAWDPLQIKFDTGFNYLLLYINENSDALVPKTFVTSDGFKLGDWVSERRRGRYKMDAVRRKQLESLDLWVWNVR